MDIIDLQKLAERTRSEREIGIALILASFILGIFLFLPVGSKSGSQTSNASSGGLTSTTTPDAFSQLPLEAKAAIVYDLTTGETLYAKNADAQLPLASLTKLLTVYAALKGFSSNALITIPAEATHIDAPHVFSIGEIFTLSDLSRLTLTASLNDGAAAIAIATATRENSSQREMLASAATSLGLSQTYAVNGSGLDVNSAISGGYGSANDLARLAGALVEQSPEIAIATTQSSAQAISKSGSIFKVKNTDPIVATIPRLLLSKTGYTDLAGGNLALVFDIGIGHPIAIVVLGSSQKARFTDGAALVAATQAHFAGIASL